MLFFAPKSVARNENFLSTQESISTLFFFHHVEHFFWMLPQRKAGKRQKSHTEYMWYEKNKCVMERKEKNFMSGHSTALSFFFQFDSPPELIFTCEQRFFSIDFSYQLFSIFTTLKDALCISSFESSSHERTMNLSSLALIVKCPQNYHAYSVDCLLLLHSKVIKLWSGSVELTWTFACNRYWYESIMQEKLKCSHMHDEDRSCITNAFLWCNLYAVRWCVRWDHLVADSSSLIDMLYLVVLLYQ